MARLKTVKPRLKPAPLRLSAPAITNRDKRRYTELPWRPNYGTARWQKLRVEIWVRDGFICQATGILLIGKYPAPNSPMADHIIPAHEFWWDGRRDLFWDPENLQTLSKEYHDTGKQKQEAEARLRGLNL